MGTMDRIYPRVTPRSSMATAPLVMMIGTQLAALVSTVRVRGINPVRSAGGVILLLSASF